MKNYTFLLLFVFSIPVFAQKEANNWYFGVRAGIHFLDDGSVQPLSGSQMSTAEGCSSYSDTEGNLLFYTDGRNVWDRNHIIMPNGNYVGGTGLLGDPSSAQSAIIIPKKGDPNIYYIFTVDEPHHLNASVYPAQYTGTYREGNPGSQVEQTIPVADDGFNNGLNYSVVDLSVTGSTGNIGDVTTRNVQLYTYDPTNPDEAKYKCSEKVTAVSTADGNGFWVITQFTNKFYAFLVNSSGITQTPVVTQIEPLVPISGYRRNAIGCIKASPDGKFIAVAHQQIGTQTGGSSTNGAVYLYNFDNATGVISNPVAVRENTNPYGVEFSPEVTKLYMSVDSASGGQVWQYDILSTDITASGIMVSTNNSSTTLQLGPNGKIYRAVNGGTALDVINNPEEDGTLCNYVRNAVPLPPGTNSVFGLPPFITSIFKASIVSDGTCFNQTTNFRLQLSDTIDAVTWNFGDGSPTSVDMEPQHLYSNPGNYNVTARITRNGNTEDLAATITISATPVANTPADILACDADDDGFTSFNFTATTAATIGTQNNPDFSVRYFASRADADAFIRPLNATDYTNTSNPQTIYARIQNDTNTNCYDITSFQISVGRSPSLFQSLVFVICDDDQDGDDANGRATFNFDDVTAVLVQNTGFTTTYYATEAAAQAEDATGVLSQTYYNTTPNAQVVYARVVNAALPACFTVVPVTLTVHALPADIQNAMLTQCDIGTNPDGITQFNLAEANMQFTNGDANLTVSYFNTVIDAQNNNNQITGSYTNTLNTPVFAKVTSTFMGCYRILPLTLVVNTNTVAPITRERCDDDGTEDGLAEFVLTDIGLETSTNSVAYYASENDALLEQNQLSSMYTTTVANRQSIFARIEVNNSCTSLQEIVLIVRALPDIEIAESAVVCLNTRDYITIDAGTNGNPNLRYAWSTGAVTREIRVNQTGVYTVTVTDVQPATPCSKVRTVTVLPGNIATINDIIVEDLRDTNTVTVVATPTGNVVTTYLYSLDKPNGPWQAEPYFDDVSAGIHTLYVYDTNGCGVVKQQVAVLSIPKFFTPNGDLSNDYWRIKGLNGTAYFNTTLYIYDRYGKLITSVDRTGAGWDGTLNGYPLPATDYWYVLTLPDGRVVKGHFSLVR